jgi:O-antigen/teichoic acid export membrane protein
VSAALPHGFRDVIKGSFWLLLASGWSQGSMLFANLVVANLLGASGYGRYALLLSTLMVLAIVAQAGFGVILTQQVSSLRDRNRIGAGEVAGFCFIATMILSVVMGVLLLAGQGFLAEALFQDEGLRRGIIILAFAFPLLALSHVQQGLFGGLERFRDQTWISLGLSPLVILFPSLGAWWFGFEGALAGLGFVLSRILRAARIRVSFRNFRARKDLVLRFAIPAMLGALIGHIALWGGQTMLVRSEGGPAVLGLFAAAFMVKTMVMFIPAQVAGVLLPVLSRSIGSSTGREWRNLLVANVAGMVTFALLIAGLAIPFATEIMRVFGPEFVAADSVLIILLIATPLEAACISLYQGLQSRGQFWRSNLFENVPKTMVVLTAGAFLVPEYSATGLAVAWLLGWAVGLAGITLALVSSPRPATSQALDPAATPPILGEDGGASV